MAVRPIQQIIEDLPEDRRARPKWFLTNLGITNNNIHTMKTRGLDQGRDGMYDVRDMCEYILSHNTGRMCKERVAACTSLLKHFKGGDVSAPESTLVFENTGEGIESSLARLRQLEKYQAMEVQDNASEPSLFANAVKNWNLSLELLRKCEADCLKIMEQQKFLVPQDEVSDFFSKKITPTVNKLRSIPDQIIDDVMEQDDKSVVMDIMEKAIDKCLEEIAGK